MENRLFPNNCFHTKTGNYCIRRHLPSKATIPRWRNHGAVTLKQSAGGVNKQIYVLIRLANIRFETPLKLNPEGCDGRSTSMTTWVVKKVKASGQSRMLKINKQRKELQELFHTSEDNALNILLCVTFVKPLIFTGIKRVKTSCSTNVTVCSTVNRLVFMMPWNTE